MRCPRCHGLMAYERFMNKLEFFLGWRCVNCGEIVDMVIVENRTGAPGERKK